MPDDDHGESAFERLLDHIQASRGLDFRGYKRSSLRRRVALRMEQVGCADLSAYLAVLGDDSDELAALSDTLLINVTAFLRDGDAWASLAAQVVPEIVARKRGGPIRLWSAGCATGEEVYSLAILFAEAMGIEAFRRQVRIFGTDLDEPSLAVARAGLYDGEAVAPLGADRIAAFFEPRGDRHLVQPALRKNIVFGCHNLVTDAPISRVDLLACRNVLIYFEADTQQAVLPRLHQAVGDGGCLFLGKAETQLAHQHLFHPVNLHHRIFRKHREAPEVEPAPPNPAAVPPAALFEVLPKAMLVIDGDGRLALANPAAARLTGLGRHDLGRPFAECPLPGSAVDLAAIVAQVAADGRQQRFDDVANHAEGGPLRLTIEALPVFERRGRPAVVTLVFTDTTSAWARHQAVLAANERLERRVERLTAATEELETANERLLSRNHALASKNAELSSLNAELEACNDDLRAAADGDEALAAHWGNGLVDGPAGLGI